MIISNVVLAVAIFLLTYMAGKVVADAINSFGKYELIRGVCELLVVVICVASALDILFFLFTLIDLKQAGVI